MNVLTQSNPTPREQIVRADYKFAVRWIISGVTAAARASTIIRLSPARNICLISFGKLPEQMTALLRVVMKLLLITRKSLLICAHFGGYSKGQCIDDIRVAGPPHLLHPPTDLKALNEAFRDEIFIFVCWVLIM